MQWALKPGQAQVLIGRCCQCPTPARGSQLAMPGTNCQKAIQCAWPVLVRHHQASSRCWVDIHRLVQTKAVQVFKNSLRYLPGFGQRRMGAPIRKKQHLACKGIHHFCQQPKYSEACKRVFNYHVCIHRTLFWSSWEKGNILAVSFGFDRKRRKQVTTIATLKESITCSIDIGTCFRHLISF